MMKMSDIMTIMISCRLSSTARKLFFFVETVLFFQYIFESIFGELWLLSDLKKVTSIPFHGLFSINLLQTRELSNFVMQRHATHCGRDP